MASDTSNESTDTLRRRGIFAGALATIAALVVGRSSPAAAQTGQPLLIGTRNTAEMKTSLELIQDPSIPPDPCFGATQGASMAGLGGAPIGDIVRRFPASTSGKQFTSAAVAGMHDGQVGAFGYGGPAGVGVWAASEGFVANWGASLTGVGVLGQTYPAVGPGPQTYPASGVLGIGGSAPGIWGKSNSSIGAWGVSDTAQGVVGQTGQSGSGPVQYPTQIAGVLGIGGGGQTGVWGVANGGGIGSWGQSADGIGVSGESANRIGAWFKVGNVTVDPKTLESAALHTTAQGGHVSTCARADTGVALMAETSDPKGTGLMIETPAGGVAIMAMGRIVSSEIMLQNVAKGTDATYTPCIDINPNSHVSIMLRSDVGAVVSWVELLLGNGIIVHFDRKTRAAGTFTYAVSEMMAAAR